jgi:hypothetical protein
MPRTSDEHSPAILNLLDLYPDRWSEETLLLALSGFFAVNWDDLARSLDRIERIVRFFVD